MNSCRSIEFAACTPPLITFSIGTGSVAASSPPRWRKSGCPASAAAAFAVASETPRIAFAPSRPLFGVPSSSISRRSRAACSAASMPRTASRISPHACATAFVTPLPPQLELGVVVQPARDIDGREQHVAELLRTALGRVDVVLQLAHLLLEVGERALDVYVLEAHGPGALLHLARMHERRQRLRNVVE